MDPNDQQPQQLVSPQPVQQQVPQPVHNRSPLPKVLLILLVVLIVLGLIGGAYLLGAKNSQQQMVKTPHYSSMSPTSIPTTQSANQDMGWLSYTNKTYKYSFKYPSSWTLDASNAEPKTTASNLMTSASFVTLTTPEGYQLKFSYNLYGVGGSGISFNKYTNITIDGESFTKAYLNNCYGPDGPQSNVTPVPTTCQNIFNEITYVPNANFTDKLAGTLFDINNKTASLTFSLGNNTQGISLDNPAFQKVDITLDQVINSFKLPTQ